MTGDPKGTRAVLEESGRAMTTEPKPELTEVQSWSDVPAFASEDEERSYWDGHSLGDALLDQMEQAPIEEVLERRSGQRSAVVVLRLAPTIVKRAKSLARKRGMTYRAMLEQFVAERLAAEE